MTTTAEIRKPAYAALKAAQKRLAAAEKQAAAGKGTVENTDGLSADFLDEIFGVAPTNPTTIEVNAAKAEVAAAQKMVDDAEEQCRRRDRANRANWLRRNNWWHVERGGGVG